MLFHSSVRRELAKSFGATMVVILTIVITMMLIRTIGMAASGNVAPQDVVLLLGYLSLGYLPTMLALSLFVAVVLALGRMYRDSEMAIWFSAGLGLQRFVRPVLQMAWPVLLVIGALLLFVWPWSKRSADELRQRYEQRSDLSRISPGVFQTSRDGKQVFFIDSASLQGVVGHHVFVLSQQERADANAEPGAAQAVGSSESVTTADSGRLVTDEQGDRLLRLQQGQRNDTDSRDGTRTLYSFERYEVLVGADEVRRARRQNPQTMDSLALWRDPQPRHLAELVWRVGLLLAAGNLLLLGVGLSATHPRRASNWNLLFALLAFISYFNLVNLSQTWVASGRLSAYSALWALHGLVLLLALGLIAWRDYGSVRHWRAGWGTRSAHTAPLTATTPPA